MINLMSPVLSTLKSSRISSYVHNYLNNFLCYETARKVQRYFCTTSSRPAEGDKEFKDKKCLLPPEPQDCCMSGCSNCVWIKYAEEVAKLIDNGGEVAKAKILEHVKDPNLRAFLMIELEDMLKKKKNK